MCRITLILAMLLGSQLCLAQDDEGTGHGRPGSGADWLDWLDVLTEPEVTPAEMGSAVHPRPDRMSAEIVSLVCARRRMGMLAVAREFVRGQES